MTFWFIYIILPVILFVVCIPDKRFHAFPFIVFLTLSMIRYDTVSDYFNYVVSFWEIRKGVYTLVEGRYEPGYWVLNKLFSFSKWGFIPLLALSIFFPFKMIYELFKQYNVVIIGTLLFIFFGYITRYENIVRQGIAMGIFYYSIKYIKRKDFIPYLLLTLVAALFHSSGLIMLPYYFLVRYAIKTVVNPFFVLSILSIVVILSLTGAFININIELFSLFDKYALYAEYITEGKTNTGLGIIFLALMPCLPLFVFRFTKKEITPEWNMVINLSWLSAIGFFVVKDFFVVNRVFEYLYIYQIISLALLIQYLWKKKAGLFAFLIILPIYYLHINSVLSYYGKNTYKTILSQDCFEHRFYIRHKDISEVEYWQNRNNKIQINP